MLIRRHSNDRLWHIPTLIPAAYEGRLRPQGGSPRAADGGNL